MKRFQCQCGNAVYFENTRCLVCQRQLGFDPVRLKLLSLQPAAGGGMQSVDGTRWQYCQNQALYCNCNWLLPADAPPGLCLSCGLNEVIPALDTGNNLQLWTRVEIAKRRLLYSLLSFGLKLQYENGTALRFRLLEDRQRNPNVLESFVAIGHRQGTITINIAEADDATRHAIRQQMSETYRTMLGHLRHESGHYYFTQLVTSDVLLEECRELFGDERVDYASSLERYYQSGPAVNWAQSHISAYASAHPFEDFAETFAHFLHISDALETAAENDLLKVEVADDWLDQWAELAVCLNEVNRSLGLRDVYAFYLSPRVKAKLEMVDALISRRAPHPPAQIQPGGVQGG
jgi:hypothetical protein